MNYQLRSHVSQTSMELQQAGEELSTGRRSDMFGDLGPRAAVAIIMRGREENTEAYQVSNEVLENKLQAMLDTTEAMRDTIDGVMQTVLLNTSRPGTGVTELQDQARSALESLISNLNTAFNGDYLFAGTSSNAAPMTRWGEVNADTGYSPESAIAEIVGSGPTTVAEVNSMIADLDALFDSAYSSNPDLNYESTFYTGTPELDEFGDPNNRVAGRIDVGQQLEYGVQANDEAFRQTIKGLAMLSAVDVSQISDMDVYEAWMAEVTEEIGMGQQGVLEVSTDIGFDQQLIEKAQEKLSDLSIVQTTQIGLYENIDTYEVTTRLTSLETQLQASYSVSSRLSQLTILNWI